MVDSHHARAAVQRLLSTVLLTVLATACGRETQTVEPFHTLPVFERALTVTDGIDTLSPVRLQFFRDTLYISCNGRNALELFSPDLQKIGSVIFSTPVSPTSFAVTDSAIYVSDHAKEAIAVFDRRGELVNSFGLLPDQETRLSPFALCFYGGVLYVTDLRLRRILAVSMADAPGITETGELILIIPADSIAAIGFPSAVYVTDDGRLLAGDARNGTVRVYTCDGRPIRGFNAPATGRTPAPQGFAFDNVIDPSMQDSASFDPSGIRGMGRIHVADANNAQVHMFNPLGEYIASYPGDNRLRKPSSIAIDTARRRIYIADPQIRRIVMYTYED